MRISAKGIDLIKYFTECKLSSYYNTANVLAIGYGHTGSDVKRNMKITQEQAEALLQNDLAHVEYMLNVRFVGDKKLKQNQYDAVCSFVYSVGVHAFLKSTMFALLMKKDYENASNQFARWNKVMKDGRKEVSQKLTTRRIAEKELFDIAERL
jgi:lysozyme